MTWSPASVSLLGNEFCPVSKSINTNGYVNNGGRWGAELFKSETQCQRPMRGAAAVGLPGCFRSQHLCWWVLQSATHFSVTLPQSYVITAPYEENRRASGIRTLPLAFTMFWGGHDNCKIGVWIGHATGQLLAFKFCNNLTVESSEGEGRSARISGWIFNLFRLMRWSVAMVELGLGEIRDTGMLLSAWRRVYSSN